MAATPTGPSAQREPPARESREPDRPVLPDRAPDDLDIGWGETEDGGRDDEWYRRERPPHHE